MSKDITVQIKVREIDNAGLNEYYSASSDSGIFLIPKSYCTVIKTVEHV